MIGPEDLAALRALRGIAEASPVDMRTLPARLETPEGKTEHMAQMTAQSVELTGGYLLTFAIENGHPGGSARHLTVSYRGRLPELASVWQVARLLGFDGSRLQECQAIWVEELKGHGRAVNVVQLIEDFSRVSARTRLH